MNKFSVLLWLADISSSTRFLLHPAAVLSFMGATVATGVATLMVTDSHHKEEFFKALRARARLAAVRLWCVCVSTLVLIVVLPNKSTILAIAVSEAGQAALSSPSGQEITHDALTIVKKWLHDQIKEDK